MFYNVVKNRSFRSPLQHTEKQSVAETTMCTSTQQTLLPKLNLIELVIQIILNYEKGEVTLCV